MCGNQIPTSSDDDSDEDTPSLESRKSTRPSGNGNDSDKDEVPAPKPHKPARRSHDDLSENIVLESRTRTERRPSEKQGSNDKENVDTLKQKLKIAQKALAKAQGKAAKQTPAPASNAAGHGGDDCESEEREDSEVEGTVTFSSSIKAHPPLPAPPPRKAPVLKKFKVTGPPQTSSRAFLTLPEPSPQRTQSTLKSSLDDMDLDIDPPSNDPSNNLLHDDNDAGGDAYDGLPGSSPSHGRGRAPHKTPLSSVPRKRRGGASSPPTAPAAKRKRREPRFSDGFVPTAGGKPKAADYEPVVRALLLRAMVEYVVRILTKNAFPPVDVQLLWAKECFRSACRAADAYYGITDRMLKLIAKRGSHIRSQIITACRALFAAHYKFNRTSTSKAAIKANAELAASLCDEARFSYKDIQNQTGYAENTIFNDIRRAVIFKTKKAIGAIFQSHFNPYPLEAVALEFTTLQFCTIEWSTGQFVQTKFEEKEVGEAYITHLNDIRRWEELDKIVVRNIRAKWFKRAIGPLKLAAADGPSGTHIDEKREDMLRQELAGRTGETDSEDENEGAQAEP